MATYEPISLSDAVKLPKTYLQAAHAFLYAKLEGKFLGKYDKKYAVMVKGAEEHGLVTMDTIHLGHNSVYCYEVMTLLRKPQPSHDAQLHTGGG